MRRLGLACVLIFVAVTFSHGQNSGVVGIATEELQIFSAQATLLASGGTWQCMNSPVPIACPFFPDHGFGANFLSYCNTAFIGSIDLEWSPTGSTTSTIVLAQANYPSGGSDSACHTLQVGGYFPNMRSVVKPTSGSLSAWYTASAAPIPLITPGLGSNGSTAPIVCDQNIAVTITTGGTIEIIGPTFTGDTVVLCGFSVSLNGAASAGNLQVVWAGSIACTGGSLSWESFTTSLTPQFFAVPYAVRSLLPSIDPYACLVNNSGATVYASFSFASVHGL